MTEKNGFFCADYLKDESFDAEAWTGKIDYLCKDCSRRRSCKTGMASVTLDSFFSLFNPGRAYND